MKRISLIVCTLALLACFCIPAQAAQEDTVPYVCDTALLLTDEEWASLEAQAEEISQKYQCGVYFITVDDFTDYYDGSVYEAAKAIYTANSLGWGGEKSGVMLLLSMAERDYSLIAYGYGNTAFTDYGKDYLADRFLDDFADDDWAEGCRDYLNTCSKMLEQARSGNPLDRGSRVSPLAVLLVSLALGFAVALLICGIWRAAAKKRVSESTQAQDYLPAGGMQITSRQDRFTHITQTRRKIEKSSSSSGGTTVDSSGFSGKSGKF